MTKVLYGIGVAVLLGWCSATLLVGRSRRTGPVRAARAAPAATRSRTRVGIHGTDDPSAIRRAVSHGCVRLPNAAIRWLFEEPLAGTPVMIMR